MAGFPKNPAAEDKEWWKYNEVSKRTGLTRPPSDSEKKEEVREEIITCEYFIRNCRKDLKNFQLPCSCPPSSKGRRNKHENPDCMKKLLHDAMKEAHVTKPMQMKL